jgi:protein-disulfide isomerase
MSTNKIVLLVVSVAILLGTGFLIIMDEPSEKKYVEPSETAYPKMKAMPPLVDSKVVAKINGKEILEDELIGTDLITYYGIKQKEFEFKMGRLRRYLTQHFIELKAKELNISPEEYVRNYVVKDNNVMPSESEIEKFAKEQGLPSMDQIKSNDQAMEQITQFLRMKKEFDLVQIEVNKWTKNHKVEYFFPRPSVPIEISTIGSPSWGPEKAKVTIIKFSDFECPFCAKSAEVLLKVKKKYGDNIRLVYKHFPLPMHSNAIPAALASVCVYNQKPQHFWKFYEKVLNIHNKLSDSSVKQIALDLKVNKKEFEDCLNSPMTKASVQQDMELAERLGLESTPVFFINGEIISGAAPVEAFSEIIDYHLGR